MVQQPVQIDAVPEHPFVSPSDQSSYYCNGCERYSRDFYNSAVKTGYRRCRACHQKILKARQAQQTNLDCLVIKLKSNFKYQGRRDLAKAVTTEHVNAILSNHGIKDQVNVVKTISSNFDPVARAWLFTVVFKGGQRTATGCDRAGN